MKKWSKLILYVVIMISVIGTFILVKKGRVLPIFSTVSRTQVSQSVSNFAIQNTRSRDEIRFLYSNPGQKLTALAKKMISPRQMDLREQVAAILARSIELTEKNIKGERELASTDKSDSGRGSSNLSDLLMLVNKMNSLTADYVPPDLVVPDVSFTFKEFHEKKLMRRDAAIALERLFDSAKEAHILLYAISGYRSYRLQQSIFNTNASQYGFERANQFSAQPGQSEHQTGLTMDVSSASVGYCLTESFAGTEEGKWIKTHAAEYGFILRYPMGKEEITGYQYEPWHLRYVGREVAKEIASQGITLEEYVGNY